MVVEAVERHIERRTVPERCSACYGHGRNFGASGRDRAGALPQVFVPRRSSPALRAGSINNSCGDHRSLRLILSAFQQQLSLQSRARRAPATEAKNREATDLLAKFFGQFNRASGEATNSYVRISAALVPQKCFRFGPARRLRGSGRMDRGQSAHQFSYLTRIRAISYLNVQLPNSASLQRTRRSSGQDSEDRGERHRAWNILTASVTGFSLQRPGPEPATTSFRTYRPDRTGKPQGQSLTVPGHQGPPECGVEQAPRGACHSDSSTACHPRCAGTSGRFTTFILEGLLERGTVEFLNDSLNKFMAAARKRPEIAKPHNYHFPARRCRHAFRSGGRSR